MLKQKSLEIVDRSPVLLSRNASIALERTVVIWSPHVELNRLNMSTKSEESTLCFNSECASRILKPTGYSVSPGSKRITSLIRFSGIRSMILSIRSPWGSSTATPLPSSISWRIRFIRSVDLPVPVLPMM